MGKSGPTFNSGSIMRLSDIKWPRTRRKGRYIREPKTGTRLIPLGETLREAMMAGPVDAPASERIIYGWLLRFGIPFDYQVPVMGGRAVPGGAVVDFLIYITTPPTVLRVMSYWHTDPAQREIDALQKAVLEEDFQFRVVDIWEWETMDWEFLSRRMRELIFTNATTGSVPEATIAHQTTDPFEEIIYGFNGS